LSPLIVPGAVVGGKYRLETVLGYGGMGSVWEAMHLGLHKRVAVKLIGREFAASPEIRARFDNEAKAAAKLQSRHVVHIYDNGELDDGTPYIAMELLTGESLRARLKRDRTLSLKETVDILLQVCRALGRAHAAGIVHRDIKPDNLFLADSQDDDNYVVKVLDFGIAKIAPQAGITSSTRTGSAVGTPDYMSPEQMRGLKSIDKRTDYYSLGLVAYRMLTGERAFQGDSFADLAVVVSTTSPRSLLELRPDLPPAMEDWFRRASARDPSDRFQTAQELSEALVAASGGVVPSSAASAPSLRQIPASPDSNARTAVSAGGSSGGRPIDVHASTVVTGASSLTVGETPKTKAKPVRRIVPILALAALAILGIVTTIVVLLGRAPTPAPVLVEGSGSSSSPTSAPADTAALRASAASPPVAAASPAVEAPPPPSAQPATTAPTTSPAHAPAKTAPVASSLAKPRAQPAPAKSAPVNDVMGY
jgi:serine/threonine-protein kinase